MHAADPCKVDSPIPAARFAPRERIPGTMLARDSSMEPSELPVLVVTGSSGLIGSRLINSLRSKFRIFGLDQKAPSGGKELGYDFIQCDLTEDESVARAFLDLGQRGGGRIASVIHLAAYYDFSGEPSPLYEELTIEGTRRLLRELRPLQVEQLIFSSSLLVMRPSEAGEKITERSPVEGVWEYPQSKIAAEDVIRSERGSLPALILRIAGVYDEDCHSIPIAQHVARIYERKLESYLFPGNPDHGQPFVHLDDLVDCVERAVALRAELPPYDVLLIAERDLMTHRDLQERLGELIHGKEWPTIRIPKPIAKAGAWVKEKLAPEGEEPFIRPWMVDLADDHYPVAIDRARKQLGWTPRHTLRETLDEMIARMKADPKRWYERNQLPLPEALEPARKRSGHEDEAA
jgi:nucleoside-diphosphate-sugar epimerase